MASPLPYLEVTSSQELPFVELERRRYIYFSAMAVRTREAMAMHGAQGNLTRTEDSDGKKRREWGNVTEHCLVEAARVDVLADVLGLPEEIKEDLVLAAAVHDFYKRAEIGKLRANNTSWEAYAEAQTEAEVLLGQSGFSDRVIFFATAVGHETALQAEELAGKDSPLTPEEIGWLVAHYVDDYTIDTAWVVPATEENGIVVNSFDRRMAVVRQHALPDGKYHGIDQAGFEHFGEPTYDVQERAGHLVEQRLAQLLGEQGGVAIEPKHLPEFVDQQITGRIMDLAF